MDIISRSLAATPILKDLPLAAQIPIVTIAFLLVAVAVNVAQQLFLPKSTSAPPVVFHYVPFVGSAVTYGMDPYTFFFECRKTVSNFVHPSPFSYDLGLTRNSALDPSSLLQYGDVFTFILLGRKVTVALGPKGSNLILNGKLTEVSAEDVYQAVTTPVFGKDAVYDVPNAVLMEQKRFVKAGLTTDNLKVYVGQIVDEVEQFITKDAMFGDFKSSKTGKVDIFKAMCEITILTASRTLQGQEVRENLDKSFANLYHDLDAGFTPINFIMPGLPLPANYRRDRAQKKMSRFYRDIIEKRRAEGGGEQSTTHDMIATLMEQKYKNGRVLTDIEMAHIMIALLMAGQHTSSATGSWALLRLGANPEIIQQLYDEQVKVYGDGAGGLRPLDYETSKSSLPVLDAVIRETLRMHPPLHSLMRRVLQDLPVPPTLSNRGDGKKDSTTLVIPKGHDVLAAPGVSAIDPLLWPEADTFLPSRWLEGGNLKKDEEDSGNAEGKTVDYGWGAISTGTNSPYLPFGAGRHRCIGEQFAYLQLGTIIATMVREFDWKTEVEGKIPEPDYTSMVVLPKPPCYLVLTKRQ